MFVMTLQRTVPERLLPRIVEQEARALYKPAERVRTIWPTRILLAIDGSAPAQPAIVTTHTLALRSGSSVETLTVYVPRIPIPTVPERHGLERCEAPDRAEAARLIVDAQKQLVRLVPERRDRRDWSRHFDVGDPGATIVRFAKELEADLIVVGIGPHNPDDRRFSGHTAMAAARYGTVPLYAAAVDGEAPTECVVVLPDGMPHAPTLRAAVHCLLPGGRMWIAVPDRFAPIPGTSESEAPRDLVKHACGSDLAREIDAIEIERVMIRGNTLAGVLQLAEDVHAQLIAVPNIGDPGVVRIFLPNLAEPLLMSARCSVLVVPNRPHVEPEA
jgi:nucleotide-binding universal stress UspA family protein